MIPGHETLTVEFKSDKEKISDSDIFDAVVAFANTDGGEIYLGVENDGTVTGIHEAHKNPVTLNAHIANNTIPPISVRVEILDEDKPVIKISVPKSSGGIAATASGKILRRQIKLDGTPENIPMYPVEMPTRLSNLRLLDYSAMTVSEASIADFDPLEIERLRGTILAYDGDKQLLELQDEDLFKALGFAKEVERRLIPTITGLLMIGRKNKIEVHLPTHSASFQVLVGLSVKTNEDMALPLLAALEMINAYIDARNPENEIEMGLFRMPVPDFNQRAVREAIVNAFAHRDYTKLGRVRVCISDEGLTIANPGGFVEGVTIDNLLTAEPFGRNLMLSDALKRVGLAEKTGRGIDRIFEGSLVYGKLPPDYSSSTSTTVSLLIPRCAPDVQFTKFVANVQNRSGRPIPINTLFVLNALRDAPKSNVHQISEMVNLSETTIRILLDNAIEAGIVEAYGSGRGKTYTLSREIYKLSGKIAGYVKQKDIDDLRRSESILSLASSKDFISRSDITNLLHVNGPSAYRVLKKLADDGKLVSVNKGRYAKYRLNMQ